MLEQSGRLGWPAALALLAMVTVPVSTVRAASIEPGEPGGVPHFACGAARTAFTPVPGLPDPSSGAGAPDAPGPDHGRDPVRLHPLGRALDEGHFRGGSGVRVQCVGAPAEASYPITWQLRLEQLERVETLDGEHLLTAFEERYAVHDPRDGRRVAGALVAEVVTLPDAGRWRIGADGTTLHARRGARRIGAPCTATVTGRCSVEVGLEWRLGGTVQHPELSLVRYVNGAASGAVLWRLQR